MSHRPSISLGGKIVEVGRTPDGANEIVFEVTMPESPGQLARLSGVSDTFAKHMAKNLYEEALITVELTSL